MYSPVQIERLKILSKLFVDQRRARIIVEPQKNATGFWFGGGNMIEIDGILYISGRYRNYGDSRAGLGLGERGLELAIFRSEDAGAHWRKISSFTKSDLAIGDLLVLSIEGSALHKTGDGIELFVSSEKSGRRYVEGLDSYRKEGTGIWSIDRIAATSIDELDSGTIHEVLRCDDPRYVHVKDPFVYDTDCEDMILGFCTHPFNWASSNTGFAIRSNGEWTPSVFDNFPRGTTWDVAMARATAAIDVPREGVFTNSPKATLLYYDGGESVRNLDEHKEAISRPRGYSCEELGGVAFLTNENFDCIHRLSKYLPYFVSPMGTGTSRYVDVLKTAQGYYTTWQQSQPDLSQPLVMNFICHEEVREALRG